MYGFLVTNTYNTNIRCKIFEPMKNGKGKLVYLYITQNQMQINVEPVNNEFGVWKKKMIKT